MDREKRRVKRARLRKARARNVTEAQQTLAQRHRAQDLAASAAASLLTRDWSSAVEHAARAAALAPRDPQIAGLYVEAAEATRSLRHRIAALEHLVRATTPTCAVLTVLAELQCAAGNQGRSLELLAQARAILPRRRANRGELLAHLEALEWRLEGGSRAGAIAGGAARGAARQQVLLLADRGPAAASGGAASSGHAPAPGARVPSPLADRAGAVPTAAVASSGHAPAPGARAPSPSAAGPAALAVPPATLEIPVTLGSDIAGLDALARPVADDPDDVTLALMATALHDAESFDRLLALEHAQGLLRLSHQEETARKVLAVFLGRALLADEVGLGKTIEAGLVLSEYLLRGRVQRALVLAPPSLVAQWREELAAKFGIAARTTEGAGRHADPTGVWDGPGVIVASLATARSERHREAVAARPWDLVIVDEAHTVKNHRTESYALVERLQSRFLLLLTATPIENRVEELYNLVGLIRPGHLGSRAAFVKRFAGAGGQVSESVRGELRSLLGEIMVRNTRALSGVHLPPRFARTQLVEPGPEEQALYDEIVRALRSLAATGRVRPLLSLLLQEAGSSPFAVRGTLARLTADETLPDTMRAALGAAADFAARATGSEKCRALLRALEGAAGPTIVFTRFRGTLAFLAEALARAGVSHERLDGDVPVPAREVAIERCRTNGGVLLSTDVGSEGLNLQFCHRLVNFDLPWNPMRIEQRIGRLHRIGQEQPVDVLNLCLAGSIEERILGILDERINLFELVVGEVEMILGYLEGGREFPELVLDAFAEDDETARTRSFARLSDALAAARQRYRTVKAFDEALFRSELGV